MQSTVFIGKKRTFFEAQRNDVHSHYNGNPAKRHKTYHRSSSLDINNSNNNNVKINHNMSNINHSNNNNNSLFSGNSNYSKSDSFDYDESNIKKREFQNHSKKIPTKW
mmetsp:Transcript_61330/g.55324  ORF Transcript_61330/g.55324 Transcript_61330/m.55324 type:complete len:108 (-) Transcript_61330:1251-1574(-)